MNNEQLERKIPDNIDDTSNFIDILDVVHDVNHVLREEVKNVYLFVMSSSGSSFMYLTNVKTGVSTHTVSPGDTFEKVIEEARKISTCDIKQVKELTKELIGQEVYDSEMNPYIVSQVVFDEYSASIVTKCGKRLGRLDKVYVSTSCESDNLEQSNEE